MKIFDPRAALAEIRNQGGTPATSATLATFEARKAQCGQKVAEVAEVAAPRADFQKTVNQGETPTIDDIRHGFAVNGSPKTWTGNIVSLDEWRGLSDWQKHGPDGRVWCGACRKWVSNCAHV